MYLLVLAAAAQLELYHALIAGVKKVVPEFGRSLTPEESVKLQLEVIKNVTEGFRDIRLSTRK